MNQKKKNKTESQQKEGNHKDQRGNKKKIDIIHESKTWFFKKLNKIDKPLARLTKKKREKTKTNKLRNENREVTTDSTETQKAKREYYANRFDNLKEMDNFLESYSLTKLNQEEIDQLNRLITRMKLKMS